MRNPKWHRDEIILALDLYFSLEPGQISARNPKIIELSSILNKLPIHEFRPDSVKFRNANGVNLKLGNFLAIDDAYHGKGMQSYSKLDKAVFDDFKDDRETLSRLAKNIRETVSNDTLNQKLYKIGDDIEDTPDGVKEGKVIYKLHKYYERNAKISKKKKDLYLKSHGKLDCETCAFDFYEAYGELGKGYIECHHTSPLYELGSESNTTLDDLALVCSNCHRMLHRRIDTLSVDSLKTIVKTHH